jgi:hypothetical protein
MTVDEAERNRRLRIARVVGPLILVTEFALCAGAGIGVGEAERSVGWGILAFGAVGLVCLCVGITMMLVSGGGNFVRTWLRTLRRQSSD